MILTKPKIVKKAMNKKAEEISATALTTECKDRGLKTIFTFKVDKS